MDVLGGNLQEGLGQVVLIKVPNIDAETLNPAPHG
jgi:hypothetical protein